jgi:hypothetical protein
MGNDDYLYVLNFFTELLKPRIMELSFIDNLYVLAEILELSVNCFNLGLEKKALDVKESVDKILMASFGGSPFASDCDDDMCCKEYAAEASLKKMCDELYKLGLKTIQTGE